MLIVKHPHATDRSRHARLKRAAVAALLLAACVVLSACYMEPDRVVDSNNGLTVGDGGQDFQYRRDAYAQCDAHAYARAHQQRGGLERMGFWQ